jgi:hypothetical protein
VDHAYRDRPLDEFELEVLRLILSTFRDGGGQVVRKTGTMPGFRDYERALGAVLKARTPEGKGIFDVIVPADPKPFGISCKMSATQPPANQCSFMELSNSASKFRKHLLSQQINWVTEPMLAGPALVELVGSWHKAVEASVDVVSSRYSVLSHDASWSQFQILAFPLDLRIANPIGEVEWRIEGASLNGYCSGAGGRRHRLWQVYMNSGGQMKYYPLLSWADWTTQPFQLAVPPLGSLIEKASNYFGDIWPPEWS